MESINIKKRRRVSITFKEPSLTKQYFKDECDINNIVNRFSETGHLPYQNNLEPQYGEAPKMDLKEALDMVNFAREEFDELDTVNKDRFGHNFNNYCQFLSDYEESPESFYADTLPKTDTSVSPTPKVDEKTALGSSDGGGRSET